MLKYAAEYLDAPSSPQNLVRARLLCEKQEIMKYLKQVKMNLNLSLNFKRQFDESPAELNLGLNLKCDLKQVKVNLNLNLN